MDEPIYKLTDKGLTEFNERLFEKLNRMCITNIIDQTTAYNLFHIYDLLLEVIKWDKDNVREIEERNNNATE